LTLLLFFSSTLPAPTHIYTLSLHDALPILTGRLGERLGHRLHAERGHDGLLRGGRRDGAEADTAAERREPREGGGAGLAHRPGEDRKSTRLNSSHGSISYAVFCLKKKKKKD